MPLGVSFSPTPDPMAGGSKPAQTGASPVQDAIKMLSFRMPKTVGAGAVAPASLLGGGAAGGAGLQGGMMQNWLRQLLMGMGSPTGQAAPVAAGMPPDASPMAPGAMMGGGGPPAPMMGGGGLPAQSGNPFMNWQAQEPSPMMGGAPSGTRAPGVNVTFQPPVPPRSAPMDEPAPVAQPSANQAYQQWLQGRPALGGVRSPF